MNFLKRTPNKSKLTMLKMKMISRSLHQSNDWLSNLLQKKITSYLLNMIPIKSTNPNELKSYVYLNQK